MRSDTPFLSLNSKTQKYLQTYKITPIEWEFLRKKCNEGLFTLDNVYSITENEFEELFNRCDKIANPIADSIDAYKSDLHRRVFVIFDDVIDEVSDDITITESSLAAAPWKWMIPVIFFILAIISGVCAYNQSTNGWWLVSGYCSFLGLIHLDHFVRARLIKDILLKRWKYISIMFFCNPITIILLIVHFI